jgi:serine protease Do
MALSGTEAKVVNSVDELSKSVVIIKSRFPRNVQVPGGQPVQAAGTGFIIDSNGNIVTNYHVIANAIEVDVMLKDGRVFKGTIAGGDKATDVALVKIDGTNLPVARLGDSEQLRVGQTALAIGNALDLPGAPTVSVGVISALGRPLPGADLIFEGLIQTDAAINPGNSGGPLADLDGNVIGINTAMVQFAQGVGFAIPINTVKWVLQQVLENGHVARPMLGVLVADINQAIRGRFGIEARDGAFVTKVTQRGPAAQAGIREGDVISKVGPYTIHNTKELIAVLAKFSIGERISLTFLRGNKSYEIKIKLVAAPA